MLTLYNTHELADIPVGVRCASSIPPSGFALPPGVGTDLGRCKAISVLRQFFFSSKVDMYAVEAHRSAPSWLFTATSDSVVSSSSINSHTLNGYFKNLV